MSNELTPPPPLDTRVADVERQLSDGLAKLATVEQTLNDGLTRSLNLFNQSHNTFRLQLLLIAVLIVIATLAVIRIWSLRDDLRAELESFITLQKVEMHHLTATLPFKASIATNLDRLRRHSTSTQRDRDMRGIAGHKLNEILNAARGDPAWFAVALEFRHVLPHLRLDLPDQEWHDGYRAELWIVVTLLDSGPSELREDIKKILPSLRHIRNFQRISLPKIPDENRRRDFRKSVCLLGHLLTGTPTRDECEQNANVARH